MGSISSRFGSVGQNGWKSTKRLEFEPNESPNERTDTINMPLTYWYIRVKYKEQSDAYTHFAWYYTREIYPFSVERCVAVRRIKDHSKTNNAILHNQYRQRQRSSVNFIKKYPSRKYL